MTYRLRVLSSALAFSLLFSVAWGQQSDGTSGLPAALVARIHALEVRPRSAAELRRQLSAVLEAATSHEREHGAESVFQVRVHALHVAQGARLDDIALDLSQRLIAGFTAESSTRIDDWAHIATHRALLLVQIGDAAGAAAELRTCREVAASSAAPVVVQGTLAVLEAESLVDGKQPKDALTALGRMPPLDLNVDRHRRIAVRANALRLQAAAAVGSLPDAVLSAGKLCKDLRASFGPAEDTVMAHLNLAQAMLLSSDFDRVAAELAAIADEIPSATDDIDAARLRAEWLFLRHFVHESRLDWKNCLADMRSAVELADRAFGLHEDRRGFFVTELAMKETVLDSVRTGRDTLLRLLTEATGYQALREGALASSDLQASNNTMWKALRRLCHTRDREDPAEQNREELQAIAGLRGAVSRRGALMSVVRRNERAVAATASLSATAARVREAIAARDSVPLPGHPAPGNVSEADQAFRIAERAWLGAVRGLPGAESALAAASLDDIAARLPVGTAALLTMTFEDDGVRLPNMLGADVKLSEGVSTFAYLLQRDGAVQRFELGPPARIARLCGEMRTSLMAQVRLTRGRDPEEPGRVGDTAPGTALGRLLGRVLAAIPDDATELIVCPDSSLASIPWSELPTPAGATLGKRMRISYSENLPTLVRGEIPTKGPSLLAVGGVAFDAGVVPDSKEPRAEQWRALPGSLLETSTILRRFQANFPSGVAQHLTGAAATRAAFVEAAGEKKHVHVATHAKRSEDRCGAVLVLAGGDDPDNNLTSEELGTLDLSGCELVVLAACNTNVGPRDLGESVTGLGRALHQAGVRNVISTLWSVDDGGSAVFFEAFYRELWNNGRSIPDAMAAARDACAAAGWGPGVAAAFVHYGTP